MASIVRMSCRPCTKERHDFLPKFYTNFDYTLIQFISPLLLIRICVGFEKILTFIFSLFYATIFNYIYIFVCFLLVYYYVHNFANFRAFCLPHLDQTCWKLNYCYISYIFFFFHCSVHDLTHKLLIHLPTQFLLPLTLPLLLLVRLAQIWSIA